MKLVPTLILLSQLISPCLASLSVTLAPTEEFCFAFRTPKDEPSHITGSYDVMNDDLSSEPVTAVLFDYHTEKVQWHSEFGKSEGFFSLNLAGKFHLCFGNGAGGYKTEEDKRQRDLNKLKGHPVEDDTIDYQNYDGQLRTIGFVLRVRPLEGTAAANMMRVNTVAADANEADAKKNKMIDLGYNLVDKLEILLDHQDYIKNREATHRHVVEQTYTMVMKWTLLEAFVLMCVAGGQITYLKRFFETKRYL